MRSAISVALIIAATLLGVIAYTWLRRGDRPSAPAHERDATVSSTASQSPATVPPVAARPAVAIEKVPAVTSAGPDHRVMEAPNVAQAIADARAAYGGSDMLSSFESTALGACTMDVDPMGVLFKGPPDNSRLWAAQALVERCIGWNELPPGTWRSSVASPTRLARMNGKAAGLDEAIRVVQTSDIADQLHEAGVFLLENGDPRIANIAGLDPNLGFVERFGAWTYAATLWECEAQGGCGPRHLRTLALCVNAGCREGSTYREALANATPAREMQATDAFLAWIRASRR